MRYDTMSKKITLFCRHRKHKLSKRNCWTPLTYLQEVKMHMTLNLIFVMQLYYERNSIGIKVWKERKKLLCTCPKRWKFPIASLRTSDSWHIFISGSKRNFEAFCYELRSSNFICSGFIDFSTHLNSFLWRKICLGRGLKNIHFLLLLSVSFPYFIEFTSSDTTLSSLSCYF